MTTLFGRQWTRTELEARAGNLAQVAGVTLVTLENGPSRGVRAVLFRTGSGLEFWVLVDRAFDIAKCQFGGIELGWQSPVGIRAPWLHDYHDEGSASFHRSFSGFIVTGGLDHTGPPFQESAGRYFAPDRPSIDQPLHGRLMATPGELIAYGHEWQGDRCILFCEGVVRQVAVFGEHLVLTRRYETEVGSSSFTLRDHVRNQSFFKTPHMLLYHINLGFPLLDHGAEFILPTRGIRWSFRDSRAEGIGYRFQTEPRQNCVEQVHIHDVVANSAGRVCGALVNRKLMGSGLGIAVEFDHSRLPYLVQWQNLQAGSYAVALEPSTSHAMGRAHAEEHGELAWLDHGDERKYDLRFSVLAGAKEIDEFEAAVRSLVPDPPDPFIAPQEPFGIC